jgi:hypothetical protein
MSNKHLQVEETDDQPNAPHQTPERARTNRGGTPIDVEHVVQETAAAKPTPPKVIEAPSDNTVINPFDDLDALRNAQDYDEFLSSEGSSGFNVRTLKESMHLRVNADEAYTLYGQYVVTTKQGAFFVPLQFRDVRAR